MQSCEKWCGSTKRDRGCRTKGIEMHAIFMLSSEFYVKRRNVHGARVQNHVF